MEKVQSKKDVYNFLMQECEAYLPKMDTVNIFFLKQITRGQKEVGTLMVTHIVHQAAGSEGGRRAAVRGPHRGGLPQARPQEAAAAEVPPRRERLAPPGQEVGVRRALHLGRSGCAGDDQRSSAREEEEAGDFLEPASRDET